MIRFFRNCYSTPGVAQLIPSHDSFMEDTILCVALGALTLLAASAFDRINPGLATLLRCSGGVGLIWLFTSCYFTNHRHSYGHQSRTCSQDSPAVTYQYGQPMSVISPVVPLNSNPTGFPPIHRASAQPDPQPMYQAPATRHLYVPPVVPLNLNPTDFPTIHLASAQLDSRTMSQAPITRNQ